MFTYNEILISYLSLCSKGGCIMKLEEFFLSQLYILGAVAIGIAFLQVKH